MKYADIEWRDGQPYSVSYDDIYFSITGGREESEYVFLKQNRLPEQWQDVKRFVIAETGFGTGLNFILTVKAWLETTSEDARLHYIGIEKHPVSPSDIRRLAELFPELTEYFEHLLSAYPLSVEGAHLLKLFNGRVYLCLQFMDAVKALEHQQFSVDVWYLDGFGPAKNPDLWSEPVFKLLAQNSKRGTTLATFSCAGHVRRGLEVAGFSVSKVKGHGKKREMITAVMKQMHDYQSPSPWYETPSLKVKNKNITVIGAGLAGMTVAWSLVQRGWKVVVVDKHADVAQEASGNLAGLVLPRLSIDNKYESMFYTSAFLFAIKQLELLQQHSKESFWFNTGVYSAMKPGKVNALIEKYQYPADFMSFIRKEQQPDYFGMVSKDLSCFPVAGWAIPGKICQSLFDQCGEHVSLVSAKVKHINHTGDCWQLMDAKGRVVNESEVVVIGSGVGVKQLDQTSWLPISSVRGQMTEIMSSSESMKIQQALSFDAYVTPAYKGVHCTGASYNLNDKSCDLRQKDQDENISCLEKMLPGIFSCPTELNGRVGFRAVSSDRMPVAGAVPDEDAFKRMYDDLHHGKPVRHYQKGQYLPGLYISAAHGSRGMCSSLLSAEIIASIIEGTPVPVGKRILDMLNPARFIIRNLRRSRCQYQ